MTSNHPRIGVGVIVYNESKVLLGLRIGSHGENTWSLPGGHLEFGETPSECANREVKEETGLIVSDIEQGPFTNDIFEGEQKHYVTLFMLARYAGGEPRVIEPTKCKEWGWFEWDALPAPLFLPIENLKANRQESLRLRRMLEIPGEVEG